MAYEQLDRLDDARVPRAMRSRWIAISPRKAWRARGRQVGDSHRQGRPENKDGTIAPTTIGSDGRTGFVLREGQKRPRRLVRARRFL